MDLNITKGLVLNFTLLMVLFVIYEVGHLFTQRWKKYLPVVNGLLISVIGVCIMSVPVHFSSGTTFDTRTILIGVTAILFGTTPTLIAAGALMAYRLWMGGDGLWMGELTVLFAATIGLLWRGRLDKLPERRRLLDIYLMGLVIHAVMVLCMFALPWPTALHALHDAALPVLLIFPFGTVLLSFLLLQQKDRDAAAQRILEAEQRYSGMFNGNLAVMLLIDPASGAILDANPAACRFYGWQEAVLKTMNISQINLLPAQEVDREMQRAKEEQRHFFLFRHRKASGQIADVEVYSSPIRLGGRTLLYSIVHDISTRVQAENARQESDQRFRSLLEGAPDAIFIETQGFFAYVNQAAARLFGAETTGELLGAQAGPLLPDDENILRLDGKRTPVEMSWVTVAYHGQDSRLVFARDISERKRMEQERQGMEAQLRQQQKLEAIGTLASGVAHEINNPINGIMNYAQLIIEECDGNLPALEFAGEIIHETQRVSTIVKNLLQFSRQEKESHSLASIYDIVQQTMSLIRTVIRKDQIELIVALDEDLPGLRCRSQQIQQVLMNLLTNARDALNEKYPGYHENKRITLSCRQVVQAGRPWLQLALRDNGVGIPSHLHTRIYEPFFSTKPRDVGTGLGLSISFGIIKDHDGQMGFVTEEGQFTEFIIDLPAEDRLEA